VRWLGWLGLWMVGLGVVGMTGLRAQEAGGGEEAEEEVKAGYVRFVEDEDGAARLETSVVTLANEKGVRVDLIGAVHVGDAAYYEGLNERFKEYDKVLYELVGRPEPGKPLGHRALEGDQRLQWLGVLQEKMKTALKLEGQLEKVDYMAANLVHADMDMEKFEATQKENQETFFGLWMKAMAAQQGMAQEGRAGGDLAALVMLMKLLTKKAGPDDLKRFIGREFDQVEQLMVGIEANGGTVIIGERNRVALEVLDKEMKAGVKKLGIFYGAAHFPDMEKRLAERGFKLVGTEWLTAWDIPVKAEKVPAAGGGKEAEAK
jgi:hypothetical protein